MLVKFRNATLGTGDFTVMSVTAATSIVISSGSSMGAINNVAFSLWLVGFNDAGTFRLGVINGGGAHSLGLLTSEVLSSSTAEGGAGAADSAGVIYTGTAVTGKPLVALARLDWSAGLAAVGTWGTAATGIHLTPAPVTASLLAGSAQGMSMVNGAIQASVAGSALTVAIKTLAGADPSPADPVHVLVRNSSAASGDYTVMTVMAATSVVVSSGSTLGVPANNTPFRIWVVGFNDAGTFRLGVINCLSGTSIYPLSGNGYASSSAEGGAGAADSAQTFYTSAAVSGRAYTALGFMTWDSGLASIGAWAAAPTRVHLHTQGGYLPGQEVQRVRTDTGAASSGTTLIPLDDTIPQISEGDQFMTRAITPVSPANLLEVEARAFLANSAASNNMSAALFRDSTANALTAVDQWVGTINGMVALDLTTLQLAASASSTTFSLRGGASSASTTTFNGFAAARYFGGVLNSFMQVREIMT